MIAKTEPQDAYSCFIAAFKHKPSYIMRTIPDISDQLNQLDDVITYESQEGYIVLILRGNYYHSLQNWGEGGLGIPIFAKISNQEYEYSLMLSKDLSTRIMKQNIQLSSETDVQNIKTKNQKPKTIKTSSKVREH